MNELAALQRRVFSDSSRNALLNPAVRTTLEARSPFHPELASLSADLNGAGVFEIVSAWELRTYMADVLLRDSDIMSMRHSLECACRSSTGRSSEWLWRQPAEFKHDRQNRKTPLTIATAEILPAGLAARAKKGFTLPFAIWMKRELRPSSTKRFPTRASIAAKLFVRTEVQQLWRVSCRARRARVVARVEPRGSRGHSRTAAPRPSPIPRVRTGRDRVDPDFLKPSGCAGRDAREAQAENHHAHAADDAGNFRFRRRHPRILQIYFAGTRRTGPAGTWRSPAHAQ